MNIEEDLEIKNRVEDDGIGYILYTEGLGKYNKPELELRKIPEEFITNAKNIMIGIGESIMQEPDVQGGEIFELKDTVHKYDFLLRIIQPPLGSTDNAQRCLRIVDYYEENEGIPTGIQKVIIETYLLEGIQYLNNEKYNEAISFFDKCILLKPNFKGAYKFRAETYLYLKVMGKAVEDFTRALEQGDDDPSIYFNRAIAYAFDDEAFNALKDITTFIELNPDKPIGYEQRANIHEKFGNLPDAVKDRKTAESKK